jgi:amino acid permease
MYPATSLFIAIGRLGIVLLVGLSYPLQLLPCRVCLHTLSSGLVKNLQRRFKARKPKPVVHHDDDEDDEEGEGYQDPDATIGTIDTIDTMMAEDDPLMPRNINGEEGRRPKGEMTRRKFIFLTVMILSLGFLIALVVDELEVGEFSFTLSRKSSSHTLVLGFVGSTGSTILSFILPGFFYFNLFRQEKGPVKWFALALGIYGLAVMCFW